MKSWNRRRGTEATRKGAESRTPVGKRALALFGALALGALIPLAQAHGADTTTVKDAPDKTTTTDTVDKTTTTDTVDKGEEPKAQEEQEVKALKEQIQREQQELKKKANDQEQKELKDLQAQLQEEQQELQP
jgi:hypothetical protein